MMRGLTLVELLVVLVLTSLLMTLVVQGLGTVLVNLDRVASYQQDVNRGLLQKSLVHHFCFRGSGPLFV